MCIYNSFIVYRKLTKKKVPYRDIRVATVNQLLETGDAGVHHLLPYLYVCKYNIGPTFQRLFLTEKKESDPKRRLVVPKEKKK
jgi:hypothetical protein